MERNLEPTPKKLIRAKEKGDGPSFHNLGRSLAFFIILSAGISLAPFFLKRLSLFLSNSLQFKHPSLWPVLWPLILFLSVIFLLGFLARGKKSEPFAFMLLKVGVLAALLWVFLKQQGSVFSFLFWTAASLVIVSVLEFFYERWSWKRRMRMTHQEAKEEKQESEGNSSMKNTFKQKRKP